MNQQAVSPRLRVIWTLAILLGLATLWAAAPANAQAMLYDDFSGQSLDPAKWSGIQLTTTTGPSFGPALELERGIVGGGENKGTLNLSHRVVGSPLAGGRTISRNRLQFFTSQVFQEVKFDVKVNSFDVAGCPAGSSSRARADFSGGFFNDPNFPGPGQVGNVHARIELFRDSASLDPPDLLTARGFLFRCLDAPCFSSVDSPVVVLGLIPLDTTATLRVAWDPANNKFDFQLNSDPVQSIGYSDPPLSILDDSHPPKPLGLITNQIEARPEAANCAAPIGTTFAEINAFFDNVFVTP